MEPIPDFSQRRSFPGSEGNNFDKVLRRAEDVEKIPSLLFAGLLLLIALPPTWGNWAWTVLLWGFFLTDWLLLWLLPRLSRSYGPPRPSVILLAVLRMVVAFLPLASALPLEIIGTLLVVYAFWIEPNRLTVTRQKLTSPKLKAGLAPIRVLHVGDLHIERVTERERHLNRLIEELQPDLILFSGDVINLSYVEDPQAWQAAREVLGQWRAKCGVYVVTGSPAVDLAHVFPHLIEGLPLTWLDDRRATVEVNGQWIDLIGLVCTHKPFVDGPKLEAILANGEPSNRFTILLYHTPDLAPNAANTGKIDLQFSGHTHGGQVRLPVFGALFAASLYGKRFESGRCQVGGLTLYVTRGIGLEGKAAPRVRFLCPPEIILWEIESTS